MKTCQKFKNNICAQCRGICCHEGLYVTKAEYTAMDDNLKQIFNCEKFMNGYRSKGEVCSFLGEHGCIIPEDKRFIECKLFPLEIAGLDKLIINECAIKDCMGLKSFTSDEYIRNCYELLNEAVASKILTREDVESILQNEYVIKEEEKING